MTFAMVNEEEIDSVKTLNLTLEPVELKNYDSSVWIVMLDSKVSIIVSNCRNISNDSIAWLEKKCRRFQAH